MKWYAESNILQRKNAQFLFIIWKFLLRNSINNQYIAIFFSVKYLFKELRDVSLIMENKIYSSKSISFLNANNFNKILKTFISLFTF